MQKSRRLTHNYNHFYVNCLHFKTHFLWRIISSWVAMQKKGQWNDQKKSENGYFCHQDDDYGPIPNIQVISCDHQHYLHATMNHHQLNGVIS